MHNRGQEINKRYKGSRGHKRKVEHASNQPEDEFNAHNEPVTGILKIEVQRELVCEFKREEMDAPNTPREVE